MPAYSKAVISRHLAAADKAKSNADKGKALEDLACYLFAKIGGVSITERNVLNTFESEEIDVCCWNEQTVLKALNYMFLVECKNWSKAVGNEQVTFFLTKLEMRGLDFGILLATNGITGDSADLTAAHHTVSVYLLKKIRMIVISRAEIEALSSSEQLVAVIKKKLCQLIASGTILE